MTNQRAPVRERQSYRHEAYLWDSPAAFTAAMVAFVEEGLESGEPVMVAMTPEHLRWLQDRLSLHPAEQVTFVDMTRLGRNPARIIPAWREFVTLQPEPGRPACDAVPTGRRRSGSGAAVDLRLSGAALSPTEGITTCRPSGGTSVASMAWTC